MNNPNPFIPQGSLLEQKNKKRARAKMAVLAIFVCNILLVGPLLLNGGCHRSDQADLDNPKAETGSNETNTGLSGPTLGMPATNDSMSNVATIASNPAPYVPPVPIPATPSTDYVVLKGDTLATIAAKFHVKLKDLQAANPDIVPTKLAIGKHVKIPEGGSTAPSATLGAPADGSGTYTVKSGDTLTKIGSKYGITAKALQEMNGLKTTAIKPGEKLKVPAKATAASPLESTPAATTASNLSPGGSTMQ